MNVNRHQRALWCLICKIIGKLFSKAIGNSCASKIPSIKISVTQKSTNFFSLPNDKKDFDNTFIDDLDPNNWWNSSSYRFQPTISGYYLISASVWLTVGTSGGSQTNLQIRVNGSTQKALVQQPGTTSRN